MTIQHLYFDIHTKMQFAVLGAVIFFCLYFISAHIRQKKTFLMTSILAYLLISIGLLGLAFQPKWIEKITPSSFVIVGNDLPKDSIAVFQERYADSLDFIHSENGIEGIDLLAKQQPISKLKIATLNLNNLDIEVLSRIPFKIELPYQIEGVVDLQYDHKLELGQQTKVIASFLSKENGKKSFFLKSAEGILDSTSIVCEKGKITNFNFTIKPKQVGRWKYEILSTQNTYDFGIEVLEPKPLKVLLLSESPNFEFKFLKNWLTNKRHEWVYHHSMSKDIYSNQKTEGIKGTFSIRNQAYLAQFDLIISTQKYLQKLGSATQKIWRNQLKDGLGLIVIASDEINSSKKILNQFSLKTDLKEYKPNYDLLVSPYQWKTAAQKLAVFTQEDVKGSEILLYQKGKLAFNRLQNTYVWKLYDQQSIYDHYWSELLYLTARKESTKKVQLPKLVLEDQTILIKAKGLDSAFVKNTLGKQQSLAVQMRADFDNQQRIQTAFEESGWHQIVDNSYNNFIYVSQTKSWNSYLRYQKYQKLDHISKQEKRETVLNQRKQEINLWYFLFVLILGLSILWIIQKL